MEVFELVFQNIPASWTKPIIYLSIIALLGSFFSALVTALRRGIKEEGWFNTKKEKDEKKEQEDLLWTNVKDVYY